MLVENRIISLILMDMKENTDVEGIINKLKFPVKTDFYTYGIIEKNDLTIRKLYKFVTMSKNKIKTPVLINNKIKFLDKDNEQLSFGEFAINKTERVLELINCDKLIKYILTNEFAKGEFKKYPINEEKYQKIYENSFIRTSGSYLLHQQSKKYNVNIRTDELGENDLKQLFGDRSLKNISFNGKIISDREYSLKVNMDGSLIFYNGTKNPLEWEEIFKFLDNHIY